MVNQEVKKITIVDNLYLVYISSVLVYGLIYFYESFNENLLLAITPFILIYLLYLIFIIPATKFIGKIGTRTSLHIAVILFTISAMLGYNYILNPTTTDLILWFSSISFAKLFYHPPIIYLLEKNTSHGERGSEMGYRMVSFIIVGIFTPLVGGLITQYLGFEFLIAFGMVAMFAALFPVSKLKVNYKFSTKLHLVNAFRQKSTHRLIEETFMTWLNGASLKLWKILLFILLGSSYATFGFYGFVASLISAIVTYLLGKYLDNQKDRMQTYRKSSLLVALSSFLKPFSFNAVTAVANDIYSRVISSMVDEEQEVVTYDLMTDKMKTKDLDENLVLREIIIDSGICISLFLIALGGHYLGIKLTLIIIAIVQFLYGLTGFRKTLPKTKQIDRFKIKNTL